MRHLKVTVVLICAGLLTGVSDARTRFTLQQVLGAPFASDLTASPDGRKLAWLVNQEGRRNVWGAEGPRYTPRPLTAFGEDDGQELSELRWSPDSSTLVFVRGQGPNSSGETPESHARPGRHRKGALGRPLRGWGGAQARLRRVARRLGDGPGGLRVGRLRPDGAPGGGGGAEAAVPPARAQPQPRVVSRRQDARLRERAGRPQLRRPVSDREPDHRLRRSRFRPRPHAALVARGRSHRVRASARPRWRTPAAGCGGARALVYCRRRRGHAAGQDRVAGRGGPGSVHPRPGGLRDFALGRGGRLVFPSEQDGWMRLYSLPASGGSPVPLSAGESEIEQWVLSADRSEVLYTSNADDADRRHLWRVPVSGGVPAALTRGDSIEWSPAALGGGAVAFLRSDARLPGAPYLLAAGGSRPEPVAPGLLPKGFPADALVVPQEIGLKAADGTAVHGQLFLPPAGAATGKRPAAVYVHGGPMRQMLLGWHYMFYYHNCYAMNQYLAESGYVVISVNYRSGIGYGRAFREAPERGPRGASEYQDVVAAVHYLRGRDDVDPARIVIWGGSYGGYLTALGLARNSDLFAAGVDLHGVHDWSARAFRAWAGPKRPTSSRERAKPRPSPRSTSGPLRCCSSTATTTATWTSARPSILSRGSGRARSTSNRSCSPTRCTTSCCTATGGCTRGRGGVLRPAPE